MIKRLEERYKEEALLKEEEGLDEDADLADSEFDAADDDLMDVDAGTMAREVSLPSNMDSKLWRLKVKPGMER